MDKGAFILLGIGIVFCGLDLLLAEDHERREIAWQYPLHAALYFLGQLAVIVLPVSTLAASKLSQSLGWGLGHYIEPLGWPVTFVTWLLAQTLAIFAFHYASHRYPPLWAFHRIHHCDERMEATTAFRHHPGEDMLALLVIVALAFILTPPFSVLIAAFLFTTTGDLFNHSRLELPEKLSRKLEWVIVTPRLHRVHHSPLARQTDSNFSGTFTFWDRLFGTFRDETPAGIGLDDPHLAGPKSRDFDTLMLEPFKFLWRRWRKA